MGCESCFILAPPKKEDNKYNKDKAIRRAVFNISVWKKPHRGNMV